ncbi:hypothetical protein [Mucilaginibacter flavus]|nr:hypothetical protein [Mucilaginibacter flavus]MDN3583892.1 hypothetical protein [Mucilaginibacter flavus]
MPKMRGRRHSQKIKPAKAGKLRPEEENGGLSVPGSSVDGRLQVYWY